MKEIKERNSYWNSGKWIDEASIVGCSQVTVTPFSIRPGSNLMSKFVLSEIFGLTQSLQAHPGLKLNHTSFHPRRSISLFINQFVLHRHILNEAWTTYYLLRKISAKFGLLAGNMNFNTQNIEWISTFIIIFTILAGTADGGTAVKVLCYKSEGRWFDSRWCHWNFSLT
jgi:hypothetical protein